MNGFMSPRFSVRSLVALALAGWMAHSQIHAQEDAPPAAPPAFPSDEPVTVELAAPPAARNAQTDKPATQLIPTAPDEKGPWTVESLPTQWRHNSKLVSKSRTLPPQGKSLSRKTVPAKPVSKAAPADSEASSLWTQPEEPKTREIDEGIAPIQQVQASELVAPDSVTGVPDQGTSEPPLVDPALEAPAGTLPANEVPAEMPAEEALPGAEAPEVGQQLEPVEQPVQFQESPARRAPAQYEINRTAATNELAAEADNYNGPQTATGFGKDDEIHVVGSGESYWTISKKVYGMGRYHAALAEYNKSRIPNPDKLNPGMKVVVPPVETLTARYGQLIFGPAWNAMIAPPAPAGFFVDAQGHAMYRVGKGDSLSTIAETHLGRSSRWTEILKLNQQTLKHHDSLKLGTVLRLPDDASEAATK